MYHNRIITALNHNYSLLEKPREGVMSIDLMLENQGFRPAYMTSYDGKMQTTYADASTSAIAVPAEIFKIKRDPLTTSSQEPALQRPERE